MHFAFPAVPIRQKFTGYQKDTETGLDFAEARMYENRHGRFTAVDPLLASGKSANPQSFNRYVYVQNSPIISTDPTGLCGGPNDPCPNFYRGPVYTNFAQTNFNDQQQGQFQWAFTGSTIHRTSDNRRYLVTSNGWSGIYSPDLYEDVKITPIQDLLAGFNSAANDKINGMGKGLWNAGAGTWNMATQPGGAMGQILGISNPIEAGYYNYSNAREAGWSFATQAGVAAGTTLFGGTAIPRSSTSVLKLRGETSSTSLLTMAEAYEDSGVIRNVAGYDVGGTFGRVGNTYNANIFGLYRTSESRSLISFTRALEAEAKSVGANQISIQGTNIRNPAFLSPANVVRAQRLGYTFRTVNEKTILLTKTLY